LAVLSPTINFVVRQKWGRSSQKPPPTIYSAEGGTPIGAPTEYVISDPKAWGPPDEKGIATIDDAYLKANNIYPTQLKTLVFKSNIAKIAGLGLDFLGTVLLILSVRRKHL
jgi:hypothetical protein